MVIEVGDYLVGVLGFGLFVVGDVVESGCCLC